MIGNPRNKIISGNYNEKIEGYRTTEGDFGDDEVNTLIFTQGANVTILDGRKALEYKEHGYNNPVIIETGFLVDIPDYIIWDGNIIENISNVDPDNNLRKRTKLLGSFNYGG